MMLVLSPPFILNMNSLCSKSEYSFNPTLKETCPSSYIWLCWMIFNLFLRKILLRYRSSCRVSYTLECSCWNSIDKFLNYNESLLEEKLHLNSNVFIHALNKCHSSPSTSSKTVRPLTVIANASKKKNFMAHMLNYLN